MRRRLGSRSAVRCVPPRTRHADDPSPERCVERGVETSGTDDLRDDGHPGHGEDAKATDQRHAGRNASVQTAAETRGAWLFEGQFHAGIL